MHRSILRIKGIGYILWQARHMAYHVMVGLLWVWFLREQWGELSVWWVVTGALGSVLPDIDHLYYFFSYGRQDRYTKEIFSLMKKRQWRTVVKFIATGHKHNTSLTFHNVYVMVVFISAAVLALTIEWRLGVVLFGAMVSHFLFDIADDLVLLGRINSNWMRWGRPKKTSLLP